MFARPAHFVGCFGLLTEVRYHGQVEAGCHSCLVNARPLRPYERAHVSPPQFGRGPDRLGLGAVRLSYLVTGITAVLLVPLTCLQHSPVLPLTHLPQRVALWKHSVVVHVHDGEVQGGTAERIVDHRIYAQESVGHSLWC